MLWKYSILWLGLAILGVLNGLLRNELYLDVLGDLRAHQVSTIVMIILISLYTWLFSYVWKIQSTSQAFTIGGMWLALTIVFEFVFGHYIVGNPWSKLFHDYNFLEGRIWSIVLLWMLFVPVIVYKIRS